MRSRTIAAGVSFALAVVIGGAVAPASGANEPAARGATEGDSVEVSGDGITFGSALHHGLFDGAGALVPGQSVTRELWVRNASGSPSALRVSIRNLVSTSTAFATGVGLVSADSVPGSVPVTRSLADLTACEVVSTAPAIDPGAVVRLTLTFTMSDLTHTVAQGDRAGLDLVVAMRDAAAGAFSGSACADDGTLVATTGDFRGVAFTGGSIPVPLVVGGGLLLGVGMFLLLAGRRRQSRGE
jgi:hypothetical protein